MTSKDPQPRQEVPSEVWPTLRSGTLQYSRGREHDGERQERQEASTRQHSPILSAGAATRPVGTLAPMADGELFLEDLQAAIHRAFEEGIEPAALLLHPSTVIHVSDPALGLEPLGASEIDAIDTVPIEIDPMLPVGEIGVRERTPPRG